MNSMRTLDRGTVGPPVPIHARQISSNMAMTPNGNLICYGVPIARAGEMLYGPGETPVKVHPHTQVARVHRTIDELTKPAALGSLVNAAVTDEHPPVDVTPENWKQYALGHVTNPRLGEGENRDCILADLVITDKSMIDQIKAGKREVSAGYTNDYFQTPEQEPRGEGYQANLVFNHVALVRRGRCGPRCAINDSLPTFLQEQTMPKRTRINEDALAEVLADLGINPDDAEVHITTDDDAPRGQRRTTDSRYDDQDDDYPPPRRYSSRDSYGGGSDAALLDRVNKLQAALGAMIAGGQARTVDNDKSNSVELERIFQSTMSKAEILSPGFRMPTFDSSMTRAKTLDALCAARRQVLSNVAHTTAGATLLTNIADGQIDLAKMSCDQATALFNAAAAARAATNDSAATRNDGGIVQPLNTTSSYNSVHQTIAAINKANADFWAKSQPQLH